MSSHFVFLKRREQLPCADDGASRQEEMSNTRVREINLQEECEKFSDLRKEIMLQPRYTRLQITLDFAYSKDALSKSE